MSRCDVFKLGYIVSWRNLYILTLKFEYSFILTLKFEYSYILTLKFEYFAVYQNRALYFNDINTVWKMAKTSQPSFNFQSQL